MGNKSVDIRKLSKLRREEEIRRLKNEEGDRLEVLGQESETKAAKWVKEDFKEREKKDIETENVGFSILESLRNNKLKYNVFLTTLLSRFIRDEDIPKKYTIDVLANDIGVVLSIRGTDYIGAFKSCGVPKFDFFAAKNKAITLGNTIAHLEGYRRKSDGGILLPDEADLKHFKKHGRK